MSREITITTGARLHFGLLAYRPARGRFFGGAGLMLDQPGFQISLRPAEADMVTGPEHAAARARRFLQTYRASAADIQPPACRLEIGAEIPPHSGLGSGTQLGLAVAQGLALLAGDGCAGGADLARRVGRGLRSGLGIHGFARGGLLVDGGKRSEEDVAPLVARAEFPQDWRMVLVTPARAPGLSGAAERSAFAKVPPMPASLTGELCRLVLLELLPAALEADFDACGESLDEIGRQVGEYFAPVQGGVYADRAMQELAMHLRRAGVRGIGQSSWGPTLFVLCSANDEAENLVRDVSHDERWSGCTFRIAAAMNTGATIQFRP